ncbi:MAG: NAD-dependent epimerase [Gammaproteobacteria bacterium]|nr:NAD-dependent epimerase [Gammaproteobacteria bacterium]
MKILVTGVAGFIGMNVAKVLLERGDEVIGIDNLNDYYEVQLKYDRLKLIENHDSFTFIKMDIADRDAIKSLFEKEKFQRVFNSAAQAGVRYSIENPHAYVDSNLVGFVNILEGCRQTKVEHLVYASSSSVYGANTNMPFSVHDNVDHQVSLYAATKKSNELMAHTYSHLYDMPTTGLRFFTVYGPWGRPDMSPSLFTGAILRGEAINVFNEGKMQRDFTYIDDIVEGIVRVIDKVATPNKDYDTNNSDPATSFAPYRVYNIGNNNVVQLMDFIETIENAVGKKAEKNMMEMQAGDVIATYANIDALVDAVGFKPATPLQDGIKEFVAWYKDYHGYQ